MGLLPQKHIWGPRTYTEPSLSPSTLCPGATQSSQPGLESPRCNGPPKHLPYTCYVGRFPHDASVSSRVTLNFGSSGSLP